jgi:hypothetical protein
MMERYYVSYEVETELLHIIYNKFLLKQVKKVTVEPQFHRF